MLLTDTVGFIQKLPTGLIAAFRATLEEVVEADLLLHVIDASHPQALDQARAVYATLKEIDAGDIPMINVLNKIDRFADPSAACDALGHLDDSVAISALTGMGLDALLGHIEEVLEAEMVRVDVVIPFDRGELVGMFHERGLIDKEEYRESGTRIVGRLPETLALQFDAFRTPHRTKQAVFSAG